jgi:SAM-dependent methyltransferase
MDPRSRLPFVHKLKASLERRARTANHKIGVCYNRVEAAWYDLKHGTDTRGKTAAAGLDIPGDLQPHVTGFQSVNERHLRTVLEGLPLPPDSTFVDIGCGKGKALLIAADYPFIKHAVGVELAGSLCKAAEANVERMKGRHGGKPITVIHGDAVTHDYTNGENIFFLNNPFDVELMRRMIDNVHRCLSMKRMQGWFLYGNPAHRDAVNADKRLSFVREFSFFGPGRNVLAYRIRDTIIGLGIFLQDGFADLFLLA